MNNDFYKEKGLTLLEMMIVLAMIGLLMTLAVPSYQRYTQRAKFVEVIQAVTPYKIGITLCAYQQGDLSLCNTPGENNVPSNFKTNNKASGYVDSIQMEAEGRIKATSQRIHLGKEKSFTYTLIPTLQEDGSVKWKVDDTASDSCKHHQLC